jgi:ATP-dependent exoDNAse (exonuclease V) alpha subunit
VALSGIAAENLESGSGISSRTIASLEHGWGQGRDVLTARDVPVINEAGMVGTRQLERLLSHAVEAGAKVVLVGVPQQLQSIEAARRSGLSINVTVGRRWARCAASGRAGGATPRAIWRLAELAMRSMLMTRMAWSVSRRHGNRRATI